MTYADPTNQTHLASSVQILPSNWPTSTHVHGAQVRPTFDGNPLSWFSNNGTRGTGAFSLNDTCYYDAFDTNDGDGNNYAPPNIIVTDLSNNYPVQNIKINRYPNIQNPGNLWYHDHAMRLTSYNVQSGLSGNYALRENTTETEIGVNRKN